jgi:hypothetical protein
MNRARFHRYVRRGWVERQRATVLNVSSDESISDFGSFYNTVILSQRECCLLFDKPKPFSILFNISVAIPNSQPLPSQVNSPGALSESYSVFSQNLLEYQKSTQSE